MKQDKQHTEEQHTDKQHTDKQHTEEQHTEDQNPEEQNPEEQYTDNQNRYRAYGNYGGAPADIKDPFLMAGRALSPEALEEERRCLYWLCRAHEGIGAVKIRKLFEYAGTFRAVYNMKEQELSAVSFLRAAEKNAFWAAKKEFQRYLEEYHSLEERGIQFITPMEEAYPDRLRCIYDMPMGLFVRGRLPEPGLPCAAIVGARSCSWYGREVAEYLGKQLASSGIQIVSGLAYGVDAAGQRGALKASEAVFGILGCGIDICYPKEHRNLYKTISEQGGLISEYGPGEPPSRRSFPVRNRLISGLADAVIVVEARKRSGSLITVNLALEQGKEIFAVPGRVTDPLSTGCNSLIRDGAQMLQTPEDVLEYFQIKQEKILNPKKKLGNGLAKNEKMVYSCLDSQPRHLEEIIERSGLTSGICMAVLLELELIGIAVQTDHQYYSKRLE